MANLSIRGLDEDDYRNLRIQAAKNGISMEEQARQIIKHSVSSPEKITLVFQKHFGKAHGLDANLKFHKKPHEPLEFD